MNMNERLFNDCTKEKSNEEAQKYREIGNNHFQRKYWFMALFNYNASIACAKTKAVASLGYANRSAVYKEIARFEDCLKNIQWALENEYPEDKRPKLLERKEKCEKLKRVCCNHDLNPWEIFKLSYPANEKVPWLVDCVEMRRTKKFGRGIYAKKDLKPGDIICVEDTIINYTNSINPYTRCYYCSKGCVMNLIPCDQTASMMFCSTECKEKLYSEAVNLDEIVSVDVKMLSSIAAAFGSVQKFDDFIQDTNLKDLNKTIFDFDFSNTDDPEYKRNLITCLLSLSTNQCRIDDSCHIRDYVSEKAVQHILSIFHLNNKISGYIVQKNTSSTDLTIGHHISLFVSLINHSCYSNVLCMSLDNKVITIVFKSIKKGEQIFVNYEDINTDDWEYCTKDVHLFQCKCEVDLKINEVFPQKKGNKEFIFNLIKEAMIDLRGTDHKKAKRSIKKIWDEIDRDTTLPNFISYCYPMAMSALRLITSYLTYKIPVY